MKGVKIMRSHVQIQTLISRWFLTICPSHGGQSYLISTASKGGRVSCGISRAGKLVWTPCCYDSSKIEGCMAYTPKQQNQCIFWSIWHGFDYILGKSEQHSPNTTIIQKKKEHIQVQVSYWIILYLYILKLKTALVSTTRSYMERAWISSSLRDDT